MCHHALRNRHFRGARGSRAADDGIHSKIENVEGEEPADSAKVGTSTPRSQSALIDKLEASRKTSDHPQPAQAAHNSGSENIQSRDTQPVDSFIGINSTAHQQPQSSLPNSTSSHSHYTISPRVIVIQLTDGQKHTIDLVDMLFRAKADAKTRRYKRFEQFGGLPCQTLMQNPCLHQLKMINPEDLSTMGGPGQ